MDYLVSCIVGLEEIVAEQLQKDFPHTSPSWIEDGLVCISGRLSESTLRDIPYINNSFVILRKFQAKSINEVLYQLVRKRRWIEAACKSASSAKRFRLVLSDENQLVAGDPRARAELVRTIESDCAIRYAPRGGGKLEFWILRRRSGATFFCARLSRRLATEKNLAPGELRPELAKLLCELSEPTADDVFLDPFAGSGAIVAARVQHAYNLAFAFDIDKKKVLEFRQKAKDLRRGKKAVRRGGPIIVRCEDARSMASIEDGFVDRVVTDPPWGYFDQTMDNLGDFYREIFNELSRVTKIGGAIVVLLGRTEEAEKIAQSAINGIELARRLDVLVSGKKAMVLKFRRV